MKGWRRRYLGTATPWPTPNTPGRYATIEAPGWCVVVFDVAGGIARWHGPMRWAKALAVSRFIEATDDTVRTTRLERLRASLPDSRRPVPSGWADFDPLSVDRGPRVNPGHCRRGRPRKEAA